MRRYAVVLLVTLLTVISGAWGYVTRGTPRHVQAPSMTPVAAAAAMPASVRIDQQLIRADVTIEQVRASRPPTIVKRAAPRKDGFLARARRVLFGEGRHKPAPFPSAR